MAELLPDEERGPATPEDLAVGGDDVNRLAACLFQRRRHRRGRRFLVRHDFQAAADVLPPDPGGGSPSKASIAVNEYPVLRHLGLRGRRSPDRLTDGGHYVLLGRESPKLASGHDLAVNLDLEGPTWSLAQLGNYPKLLLDRGRRTGGPGQVTSRITIDDSD